MAERVPLGVVALYALPAAAVNFTFMLTGVYLLKYTADVLLVAPGAMGLVYGLSRLWDAVSDPIAGHLSDRTSSRLGRRRSWLLLSALPVSLGFGMLWIPPERLSGASLVVWLGVGVFVYFTGTTIFSVPHEALGAELSRDHHDRTRVFGVKVAVASLGSLLALAGMRWLEVSPAPRRAAAVLVGLSALAVVSLTLLAVARLRERPEHQGRGGTDLRRALRDVVANPHAARLLLVFFVENFSTALLGLLIPFAMEYVFDLKGLTSLFIGLYMLPALLFIPVWVRLSRVVGKKRLWVGSMAAMTLAFCGLFLVGPGDLVLLCALGVVAGLGGGCGQVVGPSIQADVIDWDELHTGERKEGAYFAVWNFMRKSAYGVATVISGLMLTLVGFEPNAAQSDATRLGLQVLFSFVPGIFYLMGTLAFLRFGLDEAAHADIRRELDRRLVS